MGTTVHFRSNPPSARDVADSGSRDPEQRDIDRPMARRNAAARSSTTGKACCRAVGVRWIELFAARGREHVDLQGHVEFCNVCFPCRRGRDSAARRCAAAGSAPACGTRHDATMATRSHRAAQAPGQARRAGRPISGSTRHDDRRAASPDLTGSAAVRAETTGETTPRSGLTNRPGSARTATRPGARSQERDSSRSLLGSRRHLITRPPTHASTSGGRVHHHEAPPRDAVGGRGAARWPAPRAEHAEQRQVGLDSPPERAPGPHQMRRRSREAHQHARDLLPSTSCMPTSPTRQAGARRTALRHRLQVLRGQPRPGQTAGPGAEGQPVRQRSASTRTGPMSRTGPSTQVVGARISARTTGSTARRPRFRGGADAARHRVGRLPRPGDGPPRSRVAHRYVPGHRR